MERRNFLKSMLITPAFPYIKPEQTSVTKMFYFSNGNAIDLSKIQEYKWIDAKSGRYWVSTKLRSQKIWWSDTNE